MKKLIFYAIASVSVILGIYSWNGVDNLSSVVAKTTGEMQYQISKDTFRTGDIIFQTSLSGQSLAIQVATKSKYSHCGIIFVNDRGFYVLEAIDHVEITPLDKWIARGKDGEYVVKRLKNADVVLTPEVLERMRSEGNKYKGREYDLAFEWSDEKIYCSELVWKIYRDATGIEPGKLQQLKEFDLSNDIVKTKIKERYGENVPMNETVISPAVIFDSELFISVKGNNILR